MRKILPLLFGVLSLSRLAVGQGLTDYGLTAPVPGGNDIFQLATNGNKTFPDGQNYYTDNNPPPGQTFGTGTNAATLSSVYLRLAGLDSGNNFGLPASTPTYWLRLYSVAGGNATLLQTYTSANPGLTDGHWLKWANLALPLATNSTYAFSFGIKPSAGGYCALAVASNRFSGGQMALVPVNGGSMTFGASGSYDAVFDLSTTPAGLPVAGTPSLSPTNTVYLGSSLTLAASSAGAPPLRYQWQTDGGTGVFTNIPNATNTTLTVTPAKTGTVQYEFILTNSYGTNLSGVAAVNILPLPGTANVYVNASQTMAVMPLQGLGVCTATYDNVLINTNVAPRLKTAGITAIRFPGGSYADAFNWQSTTMNGGAYLNSADSFTNFMNTVVNPAGAQAVITVNYGSNPADNGGGDPNVAAAWVRYANLTKGWGVKYWEIGNEIGGNGYSGTNLDWEYDLHYPETNAALRVGQPALSPAAYGSNSVTFINAMKAVDPTIQCGVGFDTGSTNYNAQVLGVCGGVTDFVIIHYYPGGNAPVLLAQPAQIPSIVSNTLTQLTNIAGAAHAAQMRIAVTETGAGTNVGPVAALFAADNYLTWIENGAVNVDYQILHDDVLLSANQQPAHVYYAAQMCRLLAAVGDTMLAATSDQSLVRVHASLRQDGRVGVMLINTDPAVTNSVTVNLGGMIASGAGTAFQFGAANFSGTNVFPVSPVSTNSLSGLGNSFTVSVPPYTIVNVLASLQGNTPPTLAPIGNQTVNAGQTATFTANATDADQPPQTLTYTLLSGPTNAVVNPTNGYFSWRPLVSQAGVTNSFVLQVSDSGLPVLSATQSFTINVNPLSRPAVSSFAVAGQRFNLTVNGISGPDYAVQSSTNLASWSTLFTTNSPSLPFHWSDTNPAILPMRFYRVVLGPPFP